MVYKDFYHLMLESFSHPLSCSLGQGMYLLLSMLKNRSCSFEMEKIIPAVLIPKKLQHFLSGLKKVKVC